VVDPPQRADLEKKGPRGLRPPEPPRTDEDRLGRPLRWQLGGGHPEAIGAAHLVVALDGEAKVYRPHPGQAGAQP